MVEYNDQQREGLVLVEFCFPDPKEEDLDGMRDNCVYILDFLATNEGDFLPMVAKSSLPPPTYQVEEVNPPMPPRPSLAPLWIELEFTREEVEREMMALPPPDIFLGGRGRGRGNNNGGRGRGRE